VEFDTLRYIQYIEIITTLALVGGLMWAVDGHHLFYKWTDHYIVVMVTY